MIVATTLALLLIFVAYRLTARPRNFPPGPWNLPLVGYIPFLTKYPYRKFSQLSEKYGDVFSVQMGSYRAVVLCSLKAIKEAFKEDVIAGRPDFPLFVERSRGKGIIFSEGETWHEMRRFTLRNLRDFGFGKSSLEGIIQDEIGELINNLKKTEGKPINLTNRFNLAVVNALWTIVSGKRFSHDDPEALAVIRELTERISQASVGRVSNIMPWLSRLGLFRKQTDLAIANVESMKDIMKRIIKEHLEKHSGQETDFTHVYLNKIREAENSPSSPFHKEEGIENLVLVLLDLFVAGAETTSTTLLWTFLLLAHYPEVQRKVQQEIDSVVPADQLPSSCHRPEMPYTEAVLMEVMRFVTLVPLGVMHTNSRDIKFMGYDIPKGTLFVPHLHHVMHDPVHWEKPTEFYPEHFLHKDGTLKTSEALIPFSVGKRFCLGESLAKVELFLFAASLLQKFQFDLVAGEPKPSLEPVPSVVSSPRPFKLVITCRKQNDKC